MLRQGSGGALVGQNGKPARQGRAGRPGGNGPPDLQRMFQRVSRLPNCKLADLQKGDIV